MAWTAPRSWVTGEIVTAALLNTHLRDNQIDLDRRTSPVGASVFTVETTTSPTFTDLATAGPAVTVTIGSTQKCLVSLLCRQFCSIAGEATLMGVAVTGASTIAAIDDLALTFTSPTNNGDIRHGLNAFFTTLTPGVTTFTAKYRRTNGTGSFGARAVTAQPLGS